MIPEGGIASEEIEIVSEPTLTYQLDLINKRIRGDLDGLEAMRQAVEKILLTIRYKQVIYSDDTGAEINTLQGKSRLYVQSETQRMVREALLMDDRIVSVTNFSFTFNGADMTTTFNVSTELGDFTTSLPEVINIV